MLADLGQHLLEALTLVAAGVEDHARDPQLVGRRQVARQRRLRALAHGGVVAGQVDQVDRVEEEGGVAGGIGRLAELGDALLVELGRAPETRRRGVALDRHRAHGRGAAEGQMEAARGVDVGAEDGHLVKTSQDRRRTLACWMRARLRHERPRGAHPRAHIPRARRSAQRGRARTRRGAGAAACRLATRLRDARGRWRAGRHPGPVGARGAQGHRRRRRQRAPARFRQGRDGGRGRGGVDPRGATFERAPCRIAAPGRRGGPRSRLELAHGRHREAAAGLRRPANGEACDRGRLQRRLPPGRGRVLVEGCRECGRRSRPAHLQPGRGARHVDVPAVRAGRIALGHGGGAHRPWRPAAGRVALRRRPAAFVAARRLAARCRHGVLNAQAEVDPSGGARARAVAGARAAGGRLRRAAAPRRAPGAAGRGAGARQAR